MTSNQTVPDTSLRDKTLDKSNSQRARRELIVGQPARALDALDSKGNAKGDVVARLSGLHPKSKAGGAGLTCCRPFPFWGDTLRLLIPFPTAARPAA